MTASTPVKVKHIVRFGDIDCEVCVEGLYKNNRRQHVIQLYVADTEHNRSRSDANSCSPGDPFATASLCVPGYPFGYKETAIKDYSENRGIFDALINAKIVEKTEYDVLVSLMPVPVARILI